MPEIFQSAWRGWGNFIQYGKLPGVFLAVLLLWWFYLLRERKDEHKGLVLYTTIMAVMCICPFTAAALMGYQTRFYDYEWIWSAVPMTIMIAWGLVLFWEELREKKQAVAVMVLGILVLSGGLGDGKWDSTGQADERREAYSVIEQVQEQSGEGSEQLYLWAPKEIVEYAREADASIRLLYGRNMWDAALNAYSYDVYEEWKQQMYLWMEQEALSGTGLQAAEYALLAKQAGVNCVLLPLEMSQENVQAVADVFGAKPCKIEEYWMIYE